MIQLTTSGHEHGLPQVATRLQPTPASHGNAAGGGLLDILGGALDQNRDGSVLDDIAGMFGKSVGRA